MKSIINKFDGEYYFLSNFYPAKVEYQGITYQNSEAAFQAQKCKNIDDMQKFKNLNPSEAKKLGRKILLREDWDSLKINIMREIVKEKFIQNLNLQKKLIETSDAILEEGNNWGDKIWGTVDGTGENNLGKILMETRKFFVCKKELIF